MGKESQQLIVQHTPEAVAHFLSEVAKFALNPTSQAKPLHQYQSQQR